MLLQNIAEVLDWHVGKRANYKSFVFHLSSGRLVQFSNSSMKKLWGIHHMKFLVLGNEALP